MVTPYGFKSRLSHQAKKHLRKQVLFCNDIRSLRSRMIYPSGIMSASQMMYASRIGERVLYHIFACENISYGVAVYHIAERYIIFQRGARMSENKLLDLSFEFAVAIVNLVDGVTVPKSSYMTDQLARAGTSVGANIHEAQYAQSKKDFVSKMEIALKESSETSYWLKLMYQTNRIDLPTYQHTERLCGNIRRLLIASCKTAKTSD